MKRNYGVKLPDSILAQFMVISKKKKRNKKQTELCEWEMQANQIIHSNMRGYVSAKWNVEPYDIYYV